MTTRVPTSLIRYQVNLPNSVERTQYDKNFEVISVRDFGAVGDGITDDTAAIQAAIDSITTGRIDFPPTDAFYSSSQVTITGKVGIVFTGAQTKIKLQNNDVSSLFLVSSSQKVRFEGLHIIGTSDEDGGLWQGPTDGGITEGAGYRQGIRTGSSSFLEVFHCTFEKFSSNCIFLNNMQGATLREGAVIAYNKFLDCPFDSTTVYQSAITLNDGAEYSLITGNHFYRIVSALRGQGAANFTFSQNVVLGSTQNRASLSLNAAIVYSEFGFNSGKVIISDNHLNHNEDCVLIHIKGDNTKPQNVCLIDGNMVLANTGANSGVSCILTDCPRARIVNNAFRSNHSPTDHLVRLLTSNDCYFDGNDFAGGSHAIFANNSTNIRVGKNFFTAQTTAVVDGFGTFHFVRQPRTFILYSNSAGVAQALWNATLGIDNIPATWTISKGGAGTYTITHNMGNALYSVEIAPGVTGADLVAAVQRFNNTFVVRIKTVGGVATDADFTASVTLGVTNTYAI